MKTKYAHNQKLINELYGRNFKLESLISEVSDAPEGMGTLDAASARVYTSFTKGQKKSDEIDAAKEVLLNNAATALLNDPNYDANGFNKDTFMLTMLGMEKKSPNNRVLKDPVVKQAMRKYRSEYENKKEGEVETLAATAAKSAEKAQSKPAQTKSKKKLSSSGVAKVKEIQRIIGATDDGDWGNKTTEKWKAWITSDAVAAALKGGYHEDTLTPDYLEKNKGDAAGIAKRAGYKDNLDGVLKFIKYLKTQDDEGTSVDASELKENNTLSNNIKFGESRGSLYRKRYYGRY